MRQHQVNHAFERLRATLPVWEMYLRTMIDGFHAQGVPFPCVTALLSTVWEPGHGVSTTVETTVPEIKNASAHQRVAAARAQAELENWVGPTVAHIEALMSAVVANDSRKPFLKLEFFAQSDRVSAALRLRLKEATTPPAELPNSLDDVNVRNTPRILRSLRLAAMAKGVGTGPHWSLSVDRKRSQFRVQAPTARTALAWMVGAQVHDLPEWAENGRFLELSVDHIPANSLLKRWARIRPTLAHTPTLEAHLGF